MIFQDSDLDDLNVDFGEKTTMTKAVQQFKIVARHAGLGPVTFIIEATDAKAAFAKFKQVVYSSRQWTVSSNEEMS